MDQDRVLASNLIAGIEPDFEIGSFGTRSLLQFPAVRIERIFAQENIKVRASASIVTIYRVGGLDLDHLEAALTQSFLTHYPQMQISQIAIRPQSFVDVTGLDLIEVQVGPNQLRRNKGTFQAWYGQEEQGLRRLFFAYEIEAALPILEASRTINSGELIGTHNTRTSLMAFENLSSAPLMVDAQGQHSARGRIRQGDVITQNRVMQVPDVRRGGRIRVQMTESGIRLTFLATVKKDAMIGEQIEVTDDRGRSFQVRLIDRNLAKVE